MKPFRWGDPKPAVLVRHWERRARIHQVAAREQIAQLEAEARKQMDAIRRQIEKDQEDWEREKREKKPSITGPYWHLL